MARAARKSTVTVNFKGVETNKRVKEGDHLFRVSEVSKGKGDKGDYLAFRLQVVNGPSKGGVVLHNCSLAKQALFNLKGIMQSLGYEDLDDELEIDLEDMVDRELYGTVAHEEYKDGRQMKIAARLVDHWPTSEGDADEEEEKPRSRRSRDDADEEEEKPRSRRSRDDDEEEEKPRSRRSRDDDEEEEKPRSSRRKSKPVKLKQEEVDEMDQDELEDLVEKHDLECDLAKAKTLSKKRAAVIDALEAADLLDA